MKDRMDQFDRPKESYHLANPRGSNKNDFVSRSYQCFSCFSKPGKKSPIKAIDADVIETEKEEWRVQNKTIPCYHLNKFLRSSYGSKCWLDDSEVKASRPTCMFRNLQPESHGFLSNWNHKFYSNLEVEVLTHAKSQF